MENVTVILYCCLCEGEAVWDVRVRVCVRARACLCAYVCVREQSPWPPGGAERPCIQGGRFNTPDALVSPCQLWSLEDLTRDRDF